MKLLRPIRWFLLVFAIGLISAASSRAEVVISVGFAPPPLLVYDQPPCPEVGLIWTPGYWAYGPDGYYWVPGAWVPAPYAGALWTPGYWGWSNSMFYWHPGYWARNVGYYGGINYGFGYFGIGFVGGRWNGGFFEYNTAVWHVNTVVIHRTYVDRDWNRHYVDRNSRVAFNGGPGGIRHTPDRDERRYERQPRIQRTAFQTQHMDSAMHDRNAYYNVNRGRPDRVVVSRPLGSQNHPAPIVRNGYQTQRNEGNRNPAARPEQPPMRTQPAYRPNPPQQRQQQPEYRPNPAQQPRQPQQPEYRPNPPQQRQQPQQPEYRPQPQQPQNRPQPMYRQPENRPQPEQPRSQRTEPQYRAQPERRPEVRPAPQQRPSPQQEQRGNEQNRPQHEDHGHGR